LLDKLASHFGSGGHEHGQAPATLLEGLDQTLRAVCTAANTAGEARPQAAAVLASMRRDLFPRAAAYQPEIAS
jgi:hypothetical protein